MMSYKRLTLSPNASKEEQQAFENKWFVGRYPSGDFLENCYHRLTLLENDIEVGKLVNIKEYEIKEYEKEKERYIKSTARILCGGNCFRDKDVCNANCKYKDYAELLWNAKEYKG